MLRGLRLRLIGALEQVRRAQRQRPPRCATAALLTRTPMAAIEKAVAVEHGPVSATLHQLLHQPRLRIAIQTRVAVSLGIVFLMTVKPDLSGSLLTIGIATVLGLLSAVSMPSRQRVQADVTM